MRTLVLTNVAAPYRVELFKRSYRAFEEFHVLFQADGEPGRKWAFSEMPFEASTLKSVRIGLGRRSILWTCDAGRKIREINPEVVVVAGFGPALPIIARECRRNGRLLVLFNDGTPETDPLSGPEYIYRRWIVRSAQGFIAACRRSAEYFRALGAPPQKIGIVELTTDLVAIREQTQDPERRSRARARWRTGVHVHCAVGKLVPAKRVIDAVRAHHLVAKTIPDLTLLIAGEGPREGELRSYIERNQVPGVKLLGHLGWEEILDLYSVSDLLLFPAVRERFGMVIIEALASGVPVMATREAGATHDLLCDGDNGFVVAPGDVRQMADRIVRFFHSPGLAAFMADRARRVVETHDVSIEAERFTAYLKALAPA